MYAIEAENLVKRFGETTALAGVDLAVRPGTVLGVLGPNGAGKTTAVRVLATLLRPDSGTARVGGLDVVQDADRVRRLVGLTGQYAAVDDDLTGTENLVLIGRLLDLYDADRTQTLQMSMTLDLTRARIAELEQQLADITLTLAELRDIEGEIVAYRHAAVRPDASPTQRNTDA